MKQISKNLVLEDGSRIAVIGGGPAGSFFTFFALEFASMMGMEINIDIYEPKNFNVGGPAGCNNCGGIISESLVQMLSTEGIVLPSKVIQKGIETYTLHLESGAVVIETPFREQRIASVYRGLGPKGVVNVDTISFDNYLVNLCAEKGATLINDRVAEMRRVDDDKIQIVTKEASEKVYDLVVGAAGLNAKTLQLFTGISPSYTAPEVTKTYICEIGLDTKLIEEYFGNSMHVFLLNVPKIKFGAFIPKKNYVTLVLLGEDINKEIVDNFLNSEQVKGCFPVGTEIKSATACQCFPFINIKAAKSAFSDRMILIGDSATSKLYKNGIGSAYITGKAAARTAIFNGISEEDFRKHYQPVCKDLNFDNSIGKGIFALTTIIQKSEILKRGLYSTVVSEQKKSNEKRYLSSVLWDTFTGSAPYKDILRRSMHPMFGLSLAWNTLAGLTNHNKI